MESSATDAHFKRLREGHVETIETSEMHLDALHDLKSVNTSLVATAAYPVLEPTGELLPTLLRPEGRVFKLLRPREERLNGARSISQATAPRLCRMGKALAPVTDAVGAVVTPSSDST